MSLDAYRKKRNFRRTPEPSGKIDHSCNKLYVIQKHAASHLHYDFRLELNGVLKSWAVPKGPCLDPSVKRLAVLVEDHPIAYGSFEGIIPQGEYGAGTVTLWDTGEWHCLDADPAKAFKDGHLRIELHAEKLNGRWDLIRLKNVKNWLLMKGRDSFVKPLSKYDITLERPNSVIGQQAIVENKKLSLFDNLPEKATRVKKEKETPVKTLKKGTPSFHKTAFKITHASKMIYPEATITKQGIFNYYEKINEVMLPYIINRPITLLRCPDTYTSCFYQRHPWSSKSSSIKSIKITNDLNQLDEYLYITDKQGLFDLIQLDVLEIHPWSCTIDALETPDMVIFDLDPAPDVAWHEVVAAAFDIKKQLECYKLICFVKTTGGKGLHIVIPIQPKYNWDVIKLFTQVFAELMERSNPNLYISKMSKSKRCGKIFIDYLRNQRAASAISPYSSRARLDAPVATPLNWDELTNNVQDTFYTIQTLPARLHALSSDPWKNFWHTKQELPIEAINSINSCNSWKTK